MTHSSVQQKFHDQPTNLRVQPAICSNISDHPQPKTSNGWTPVCLVPRHNKITSNCGSQTRTTHNSRSANTEIRKIDNGQNFQTLEHKQTDLVRNTLGYDSQCKSIRTGVIWSNRPMPRINRPAEFSSDGSSCKRDQGSEWRTLLQ